MIYKKYAPSINDLSTLIFIRKIIYLRMAAGVSCAISKFDAYSILTFTTKIQLH